MPFGALKRELPYLDLRPLSGRKEDNALRGTETRVFSPFFFFLRLILDVGKKTMPFGALKLLSNRDRHALSNCACRKEDNALRGTETSS